MTKYELMTFTDHELIIKEIDNKTIYISDERLAERLKLYRLGWSLKKILESERKENEK